MIAIKFDDSTASFSISQKEFAVMNDTDTYILIKKSAKTGKWSFAAQFPKWDDYKMDRKINSLYRNKDITDVKKLNAYDLASAKGSNVATELEKYLKSLNESNE